MQRSPLTKLPPIHGGDALVRNPPFTGPMVSVTTMGGGGSSYDDTQVRAVINQNRTAIARAPSNNGARQQWSHPLRVTTISAAGGSVNGGVLCLSVQAGPQGPAGPQGIQGLPGNNGQDGSDGAQGPPDPQGIQGVPGNDGQDGEDGPQGPQGPQGIQGVPGKDGQDGAQGVPGIQGPAGQDGDDATVQIDNNGTPTTLSKLTFSNHTVTLGSSAGEYAVLATPSIANIPALTSELAPKALASSVYTKTEFQRFLNTKADSGDLLQFNTTGTTYQQITHLAIAGASVSLNGTAATVTPGWPTIAQIENCQLTTQTVAKQATMSFQGSSATGLPDGLLTFDNATVALGSSIYWAVGRPQYPALEHVSNITAAAQNVSFGKRITSVFANDPRAGTEAAVQYYMTSTMAHQLSASFNTSSNVSNYLRWYIRNTNGTLQNAMQIKANKHGNIYCDLHLAGHMYGTYGTFSNMITAAGLRIGSSGTTMPLDVDNGSIIRTANDIWNSEETARRFCRGNRKGIGD